MTVFYGTPIVVVASGGKPVSESSKGLGTPVVQAANGLGIPVTLVTEGTKGATPVVGSGNSQ